MSGLQKPQLHDHQKSRKHQGQTSTQKILSELPQGYRTQRDKDLTPKP